MPFHLTWGAFQLSYRIAHLRCSPAYIPFLPSFLSALRATLHHIVVGLSCRAPSHHPTTHSVTSRPPPAAMVKACQMCAQTDGLYRCASCPKTEAIPVSTPNASMDDVASDASLPTLDDACGALLFDERDFDLASLSAPLEALFARPTPTLEWDAVLGSFPTFPSEPVRRVKSEPVLTAAGVAGGAGAPRDPPSPLSSVTEGSASCEPDSPMTMTDSPIMVPVPVPMSAPPIPMGSMSACAASAIAAGASMLRPTVSACSSTSALPNIMGMGVGVGVNGETPKEEERREARAKALARFRSKRASRSFAKRVRYECRKQLADSRPRVKGRFVKKSEMALYRKYGDLYRNFLHEITDA